ncbi:hypothetical protein OESDEN_09427 [Oesophagostomum dentatum]|uniref:Uncharacterized protein n=1 Tax=Oesophagostomum dentatum TaxID=61180 RepID=A0A0B1T5R9_OESDE|nr:hypothetical protein OESDEN_09427 [Oesophagostomum dentatum]
MATTAGLPITKDRRLKRSTTMDITSLMETSLQPYSTNGKRTSRRRVDSLLEHHQHSISPFSPSARLCIPMAIATMNFKKFPSLLNRSQGVHAQLEHVF